MADAVRVTVFQDGAAYIDVKLPLSGRIGLVRVWRGTRWPALERTWYARLRPWIPWFSLERQVMRAIEYLLDHPPSDADQVRVKRELRAALAQLRLETSATPPP